MAYRLHLDEEPVAGLVRCAQSQVDEVLADLDEPEQRGLVASIHDARKRLKRLRALTRLVRPTIGRDAYRETNVAFRDAGRALTGARDAHVLVGVLDDLLAVSDPPAVDLAALRQHLATRAEEADRLLAANAEPRQRAQVLTETGWAAIEAWEPATSDQRGDGGDGWDLLADGLTRTYRRGRDGYSASSGEPATEVLHDWRKRVKYLRHQIELVREGSPRTTRALRRQLEDLGDLLGVDHDLAELAAAVHGDVDLVGGTEVAESVSMLADAHRADLQDRALALGARCYAEGPKAFARRFGRYWAAAREHGPEPKGGELSYLRSSPDDLDGATRDELYQRARSQGVAGRSRMRRDELIAALRVAG